MKTAKQVQNDIMSLLRGGSLPSSVTGRVYRAGMRPRGSQLEDITVAFVAGMTEQIETGVALINIYVADVKMATDGVYLENSARTATIEAAAQAWVNALVASSSNYRFKLAQTINSFEEEDIHQHYVSVRLKYEHYNN